MSHLVKSVGPLFRVKMKCLHSNLPLCKPMYTVYSCFLHPVASRKILAASTMSVWSYYTNDKGAKPYEWGKVFPISSHGKRQSPINLTVNDPNVSHKKNYVKPLNITYKSKDITAVVNSGTSVTFNAGGTNSYVSGGPLCDKFRLLQFHFHWGSKDHVGSEHFLNGRQFSAELHLVHMNEKYNDFQEALEKPDGLAVIGVFLEAGSDKCNENYEELVKILSKARTKGEVKIEGGLDFSRLLPLDTSNYTFYLGSLTTPPLSECVHWINMLEPVYISKKQMDSFRSLQLDGGQPMVDNYRPIQSMYDRKIDHCCPSCIS